MVRTFRILGIPHNITKEDFDACLSNRYGLSVRGTPKGEGLLTSLSPKELGSDQIATVTFEGNEPEDFQRCQPGKKVYDLDINGIESELVLDCDFLGMTPLYSDQSPQVE